MALLKSAWLKRNILPILVDLASVACLDVLDAIAFHGEPIIASSHDILGQ